MWLRCLSSSRMMNAAHSGPCGGSESPPLRAVVAGVTTMAVLGAALGRSRLGLDAQFPIGCVRACKRTPSANEKRSTGSVFSSSAQDGTAVERGGGPAAGACHAMDVCDTGSMPPGGNQLAGARKRGVSGAAADHDGRSLLLLLPAGDAGTSASTSPAAGCPLARRASSRSAGATTAIGFGTGSSVVPPSSRASPGCLGGRPGRRLSTPETSTSLEVRSGGDTRASILTIGMSFRTAAGTGNGVRRRFGGDTTSVSTSPSTSSSSAGCRTGKKICGARRAAMRKGGRVSALIDCTSVRALFSLFRWVRYRVSVSSLCCADQEPHRRQRRMAVVAVARHLVVRARATAADDAELHGGSSGAVGAVN